MSDPENPFFAKALVNRYWKHFFGRGLVDPEDDMRVTNPATNPELLDALAHEFVTHDFDLRHLIRTICNSSTYQMSAEPNEWNQDDKQNFSRLLPQAAQCRGVARCDRPGDRYHDRLWRGGRYTRRPVAGQRIQLLLPDSVWTPRSQQCL